MLAQFVLWYYLSKDLGCIFSFFSLGLHFVISDTYILGSDDVEKLKKLILHNSYILTLPEVGDITDEVIPKNVEQSWVRILILLNIYHVFWNLIFKAYLISYRWLFFLYSSLLCSLPIYDLYLLLYRWSLQIFACLSFIYLCWLTSSFNEINVGLTTYIFLFVVS